MLSCLLALRDVVKERRLLHAPRHVLPSPDLYASAEEVHARDLYSDDPYDAPQSKSDRPRRRSSTQVRRQSVHLAVTLDDSHAEVKRSPHMHFPENSSLTSFQWPRWPPTPPDEKAQWIAPEQLQQLDDSWTRRRRLGLVGMLREDVFGGDWWKMAIPAVLFALQNNLM